MTEYTIYKCYSCGDSVERVQKHLEKTLCFNCKKIRASITGRKLYQKNLKKSRKLQRDRYHANKKKVAVDNSIIGLAV